MDSGKGARHDVGFELPGHFANFANLHS
jgi:hypothetical protein